MVFSLLISAMIGWKRLVVTVGERIGKTHMTYAQGASAEIVAYATIEAASQYGLPVSTTHILSSGVVGTMFANCSGLKGQTVRNILLAWVLTLPVCVFLGSHAFRTRPARDFGFLAPGRIGHREERPLPLLHQSRRLSHVRKFIPPRNRGGGFSRFRRWMLGQRGVACSEPSFFL
jgi:hypothetical protein